MHQYQVKYSDLSVQVGLSAGFSVTLSVSKYTGGLPLIRPLQRKHVRLYLFPLFCSILSPVVFSHAYFMCLSVVRYLRKLISMFRKRFILTFSLSVTEQKINSSEPKRVLENKFLYGQHTEIMSESRSSVLTTEPILTNFTPSLYFLSAYL